MRREWGRRRCFRMGVLLLLETGEEGLVVGAMAVIREVILEVDVVEMIVSKAV